ncbi:TonB-dependent receptor [Ginsengibacter hankyongi]|uniref:TonB-dependent receptor n=1 Tax=Ginsengibacter hankyongi TaxID=2607284 RepID=A0A5J5IG27_9BACT|nr:outer membrane beta-barrel family protein [Ginsengibacter hankyongi]KAA9039115.1 TonB-dependent receptor [Ginsengibacter hankyongi]
MKYIFLLSVTILFSVSVKCQVEKEPLPDNDASIIKINPHNKLYGKVVDEQTKKPVPFVSVQVTATLHNGLNSQTKDSIIAATLTAPNGDFNFENVPAFDSLHITLSAVGYSSYNKFFTFSNLDKNSKGTIERDLGNMVMNHNATKLEAVTIVMDKPALQMGIDKKIFDVNKSISSKGGTAIDVMKNIPSVSVDVDGNVELRNSSPTIFIDGRPTILTLEQIPSDNIDRIELITNPSAKYDASSTGGIINIILKKNKRTGLNGLLSAAAGTQGIWSGNANLNLRQGKLNFFVSGNYHQSDGKSNSESYRQNKTNNVVDNYFNQNSKNERNRKFTSLRFGIDYFIDNRNTLTLSQGVVQGRFVNDQMQDQQYLNSNKDLEKYGTRASNEHVQFNRYNTQANYTHKFPKEGEELNASINLNYGNVKDNADILNNFYLPDGSLYSDPNNVHNDGANDNNQLTTKIDFVNPLKNENKIETGLKSYVNNYSSYFNSFSVVNGTETRLPLSNNYKYTEVVHAAYFTYTGKISTIGYQAGLRGEYSEFTGTLIDSAKKFGYEYPDKISNIWDALFPSLYLSKKLNDDEEIQLNYSRRVRRPNFWQLNPFIDINDPLNIQQGNPKLKPEFSNSMEFNYSKTFKNKSNFLGVVYYRNTQQDITRFSDTLTAEQYQQLNHAAVDPNAILNTYINAESTNRWGMELTLQQKFNSNFDITPSVSINYRNVKAGISQQNLSNKGWNWSSKLSANYKIETEHPSIFNKLSFQLTAQYESPRVIPQGKRLEQFDSDFGLRKDLFKNDKGSITFSVNDILNTHRYGVIYNTETFYQESYSRWNVRSFRITFSYKFGDSDFSLFKKSRDNSDNNNEN